MWALHIKIYESERYAIVEHVFRGRTKKEARGYYESHLKTDSFLRDCVRRGRWESVDCRAEAYWTRTLR
jgi:hypothetical protein